jgi:hypothetical protein
MADDLYEFRSDSVEDDQQSSEEEKSKFMDKYPDRALRKALLGVVSERHRQDKKWGNNTDHSPTVWTGIVSEELGEANTEALAIVFMAHSEHFDEAALRSAVARFREELTHVAASAVAAIECIDRNGIFANPFGR